MHYVNVYFGDVEYFYKAIENNIFDDRFDVYCTVGESLENGTILIYDNDTGLYVRWYKLYHLGRDIGTNIPNDNVLHEFVDRLCMSHLLERGY